MPSHFPLLKLKRKLIKKYIKLTHPRSEWDKAHYWPDIKVSGKNITFQHQKLQTHLFSNLQNITEHVNIIGSGPSINELDYKLLYGSNYNVFLNGSIALAFKHNLPIYAYVIMDVYFVYQRFDLISKIGSSKKIILSLGALCAIAERNIDIILNNEIYIFNKKKLEKESLFSNDVDSYIIDGGTVMSIAIQIFRYASSNNIYLLGLDISNSDKPRFYESINNTQRTGLLRDYEDKILPFMIETRKQLKNNIFNCSPISKLPFNIIPYSSIYEKDS